MAVITAGHHSYRKATGIEIGVQAGTTLFHEFDMESDDTDPDEPRCACSSDRIRGSSTGYL